MIFSAVRDPYPTRDQSEGALIRRAEPVVYSKWAEGAPLSLEQTQQFERDGYLVLPNVFSSDELNVLRAVSERTAKQCEAAPEVNERIVLESDSESLRSLFGVHTLEGVLQETAHDPRIVDAIQFLLNDSVYIHQSRLNFKNAVYGSGFEWHSDFETWHAEDGMPRMRAIGATVLLADELSAEGSLKVIPRSHRTFVACPGETQKLHHQQSLRQQTAGKPPALFLDLLKENGGIQEIVASAGSVVLTDANLMHGCGKNTSGHLRANLFYVYNAMTNVLGTPYAATSIRPEFIASRTIEPLTTLLSA